MLGVLVLAISLILIFSKTILFNTGSRQDDKRILVFAFVMFVLFFGCRYEGMDLGGDLHNYYNCYVAAIGSDDIWSFDFARMEKGYLVLNWLFSRVIKWPQFFFFFVAAFCCGIVLRFIYKYSSDVLLSVLGFMSLGIMGFFQTALRQSMAIAVCLLALEMAEKKKGVLFFLLVLAAMSLHQSAVIFLPIYFIMQIKVDRLFAIAESILLLSATPLVPFVIDLGNEAFERDYNGIYAGSILGGLINITIGVFIAFIMTYQLCGPCPDAGAGENEEGNMPMRDSRLDNRIPRNEAFPSGREAACGKSVGHKFLYILILGIGLYIMRYQALVMERISFYFTPVIFVLMPEAIQNSFPEKEARMLKILFILAMLFLIYTRFGSADYIPFWSVATT